jgi:hypothetical protein
LNKSIEYKGSGKGRKYKVGAKMRR